MATKTETKVRCEKCLRFTLSNGMFSEDFASVLDQKCPECGHRNYCYIGADDGKHAWSAFRERFPTQEVTL